MTAPRMETEKPRNSIMAISLIEVKRYDEE